MSKQSIPDGRKYRLAVTMMLALLGAFGLASLNPVLVTLYSELITGLMGIYFIYAGGNVGNKWIVGRKGGFQISSDQPSKAKESETTGD